MKHKAVLTFLLLAPLIASGYTNAPRPNILLIVADDMGFSDAACSRTAKIATPEPGRVGKRWIALHAVLQHRAPVAGPRGRRF